MLAGNVTVELIDGDVIVTGDGLENAINLFAAGLTPELTGQNDQQGTPTSINNVPNGGFSLAALTGDVVIRLADGNDKVFFAGAFPGALLIDGGNGNDLVDSFHGASIAKELIVDLGAGANEISLVGRTFRPSWNPGITIGTSVIIHGGEQRDRIRLEQVGIANDLVVNAGGGPDRVELILSTVGNFVGIDSGAGDDEIQASLGARTLSLQTGDGSLSLSLSCYVSQDLGIIATGGASIIGIGGSRVDGTAYVVGGQSNDYVKVDACRINELQVYTGSGSDRLDVTGSILERLYADLGTDSDWLLMTYTAVNDQATLLGGTGFDVLSRNGNAIRRLVLGSFEG